MHAILAVKVAIPASELAIFGDDEGYGLGYRLAPVRPLFSEDIVFHGANFLSTTVGKEMTMPWAAGIPRFL
jgi:hypothetical protein